MKVGDVVRLKSGGPKMTVHCCEEDSEEDRRHYHASLVNLSAPAVRPPAVDSLKVTCVWFQTYTDLTGARRWGALQTKEFCRGDLETVVDDI